MSHIVEIETEVRDLAAVRAACRRLGLEQPQRRRVRFYSGEAEGWAIELPGWLWPVLVQPESGKLRFDNYGGRWGDRKELDRFLQAYAVEKARLAARRKGYRVSEQPLADGSIKLRIHVGG